MLLSKKTAICKVDVLAEKFILLDSLLFKLVTTPDKETALPSGNTRNIHGQDHHPIPL